MKRCFCESKHLSGRLPDGTEALGCHSSHLSEYFPEITRRAISAPLPDLLQIEIRPIHQEDPRPADPDSLQILSDRLPCTVPESGTQILRCQMEFLTDLHQGDIFTAMMLQVLDHIRHQSVRVIPQCCPLQGTARRQIQQRTVEFLGKCPVLQLHLAPDHSLEFLQMKVIPTLGTNISSSLNRLRSTIGKFEPSFRAVIEEFKEAFRDCTDMFKGTFAENAEVLTKAVAEMGGNMTLINENIQKQDQLLTTLRQRDMVVTLDKFVTAANSFDSVTTSIQKLEEAKERIIASTNTLAERQESYNQSLEIPTRLLQQINAILDRVTTFEKNINALGVNIAQTQLLGNTQINAIEEQLNALKAKHRLVSGYQETQVEELDKIYQDQSKAVKDLSDAFKRVVAQNKDDIEEAMRQFKTAYDTIVRDCKAGVEKKLEEFIEALNKTLDVEDANRKLSNLDRLQALEAGLGDIKVAIADKSAISDVSKAVREGNAKIEDLARRPIVVQKTLSSSDGSTGSHKRGIWPFRRK